VTINIFLRRKYESCEDYQNTFGRKNNYICNGSIKLGPELRTTTNIILEYLRGINENPLQLYIFFTYSLQNSLQKIPKYNSK
jgi:hypothetical protein